MAGHYKAIVFRDELASELAIRLPALAKTKSFGATGEADLLIGTGATDSDSVFVRFEAVGTIQKDVLGLTQTVFTPTIAKVGIEAASTGQTWATRVPILAALVAKGVRVELYEVAHGTGPSAAILTAGNLKASFEIHPQYALMASS